MKPQIIRFEVTETEHEFIFTSPDLNSYLVSLPLPDALKKDEDPRRIFTAKLIMTGNVIRAIVIEKK